MKRTLIDISSVNVSFYNCKCKGQTFCVSKSHLFSAILINSLTISLSYIHSLAKVKEVHIKYFLYLSYAIIPELKILKNEI